ncbi:hypothetical protein [Sulfuricaulis sp.]|jgi:hypothetical protein|uniref:hypothetical protein n=1 Tax=Sulfuricaulis sp. TaxID=2003553 RepID=UPI003559A91E
MKKLNKYIGHDESKDTMAVVIADGTSGEARFLGEIANIPETIARELSGVIWAIGQALPQGASA